MKTEYSYIKNELFEMKYLTSNRNFNTMMEKLKVDDISSQTKGKTTEKKEKLY